MTVTESTPLPPPPPPSRGLTAAEGALAALGLVGLCSAVTLAPYLTTPPNQTWWMALLVVHGLVLAGAGALVLLSLVANARTRVAAAATAMLAGAVGLLSLPGALIDWSEQLDSSLPGGFVVGGLLNIGSDALVSAVAIALGAFLLFRRA